MIEICMCGRLCHFIITVWILNILYWFRLYWKLWFKLRMFAWLTFDHLQNSIKLPNWSIWFCFALTRQRLEKSDKLSTAVQWWRLNLKYLNQIFANSLISEFVPFSSKSSFQSNRSIFRIVVSWVSPFAGGA